MERKGNFYQENAVFINAGILTCFANSPYEGFRPKDLKFYVEVFSNWVETSLGQHSVELQNNQVKRLFESLELKGDLKTLPKKRPQTFRLTSQGLYKYISKLVNLEHINESYQFFFLFHFITLYSSKLKQLLFAEKSDLSPALKTEIQFLLRPAEILRKEKEKVLLRISKLEQRISEANEMQKLSHKLLKDDWSQERIVAELERKFPYQLNNRKNMGDVFKDLILDVRWIELTESPKIRSSSLWSPLLEESRHYLNQLEQLD